MLFPAAALLGVIAYLLLYVPMPRLIKDYVYCESCYIVSSTQSKVWQGQHQCAMGFNSCGYQPY
jgi:hypothetical protein